MYIQLLESKKQMLVVYGEESTNVAKKIYEQRYNEVILKRCTFLLPSYFYQLHMVYQMYVLIYFYTFLIQFNTI